MNLHEFLDNQEQVTNETFKVTDDSSANWALRKIKQLQDQQKETNSLAEAEIEKINTWADSENEKAQRDIDYFQGLLAEYALKKREENPKFKSMKLPNGAIKFRKQQPKFNYDEETLIKSLKNTGRFDLIKTKENIDKTAIKKSFVIHDDKLIDPETGVFVDGVSVEHRGDKFSVEVSD